MLLTGVVVNGRVELDPPGVLPEGAEVEIKYPEVPVPPVTDDAQELAWTKEAYEDAIADPMGGYSLRETIDGAQAIINQYRREGIRK
jgi:hypothetical protein